MLLTRTEILNIINPDDLFGPDSVGYKQLALLWHPDRGGDAEIFSHISILWSLYKKIHSTSINSVSYSALHKFEYKLKFKIDAGTCYIDNDHVLFEIPTDNADLCDNFINCMNFIHSQKDSKVKAYFDTILPSKLLMRNKYNNITYLIFAIPRKMTPLSLILKYFRYKIPATSVAWIISRMLNLSVFCERHSIALNSYTLSNFWINPVDHIGCDISGWFFATQEKKRLKALPNSVKKIYPLNLLEKKIGSSAADGSLIRNTAAKLLGDKTGSGFKLDETEVPSTLIKWVATPSTKSNFEMYREWYDEILPKSFGERKFIKMGVTSDLIYAKYGGE